MGMQLFPKMMMLRNWMKKSRRKGMRSQMMMMVKNVKPE
jgi:hypothetical protein